MGVSYECAVRERVCPPPLMIPMWPLDEHPCVAALAGAGPLFQVL